MVSLALAAQQGSKGKYADVAQLVEHHLAKVRVAGSNPVVRSEKVSTRLARPALAGGVAERRGNGLQIRVHGFESRLHLKPSERNESPAFISEQGAEVVGSEAAEHLKT